MLFEDHRPASGAGFAGDGCVGGGGAEEQALLRAAV